MAHIVPNNCFRAQICMIAKTQAVEQYFLLTCHIDTN